MSSQVQQMDDGQEEQTVTILDAFMGPKDNIAQVKPVYDEMAGDPVWGDDFVAFAELMQKSPDRAGYFTSLMGRDAANEGISMDLLKVIAEYDPKALSKINDMIKTNGFDDALKTVVAQDALLQFFTKLDRDAKTSKVSEMLDLFHNRSRPDVKDDFFPKLQALLENRGGLINSAVELYIGADEEDMKEIYGQSV